MNKKRSLEKTKCMESKLIVSVLLSLLTFLLMIAYVDGQLFPSDEEEIFLKGRAIAEGMILYKEIGSQHMPLMYYLAAFFATLGVKSIIGFRLCFYFVYALLWGICYYKYSETIGKIALAIYPLIYIVFWAYIFVGHAVLSEQLQGIGNAILLCELLIFYKVRSFRLTNYIMISIAIFISFGSAFVSVFSVFSVFLCVVSLEWRTCKDNRFDLKSSIVYLSRRYWKLVLCVIIPFSIMIGYMIFTESLLSFWGWAYDLNRNIYPKYLEYGYGGSVLESMFNGIRVFGKFLSEFEFSRMYIVKTGLLGLAIAFLIDQHKENKDLIFSMGLLFFLVTSATRAIFDFHGLPVIALFSLMSAIYLQKEIKRIGLKGQRYRHVWLFLIVCVCCVFGYPYLKMIPFTEEEGRDPNNLRGVLDVLTEEGEKVGFSLVDYDLLMCADVYPASVTGGACVWLWEYAGDQAMLELMQKKPDVFLFDSTYAVWDYSITDYADDLVSFIGDHYISMEELGYPTLFVLEENYCDDREKIIQFLNQEK